MSPAFEMHQVDLQYIAYKNGLNDGYSNQLKYFNVDTRFRMSLNGKKVDEVRHYFPVLRPLDQSNEFQQHYVSNLKTTDALWIGDSNWALEVIDGVVIDVVLLKG